MPWIEDKKLFEEVFLKARDCVFTDSGRNLTTLHKLIFDDAQLCTDEFVDLLQELMRRSGDSNCFYIVLDPDPVHYFHRLFDKYPAVEIER